MTAPTLSPAATHKHAALQRRGRAVVARLRAKSLHFDAEVVAHLLRSNAALRASASMSKGRFPKGRRA